MMTKSAVTTERHIGEIHGSIKWRHSWVGVVTYGTRLIGERQWTLIVMHGIAADRHPGGDAEPEEAAEHGTLEIQRLT